MMDDFHALETAFMARRPEKMDSLGTPLDLMADDTLTRLVLNDHERGVRLLAAYRSWVQEQRDAARDLRKKRF